jgi:hypothetical protein
MNLLFVKTDTGEMTLVPERDSQRRRVHMLRLLDAGFVAHEVWLGDDGIPSIGPAIYELPDLVAEVDDTPDPPAE